MPTAAPNVWEACLKAHDSAREFHFKPFKYYFELKDVFTDMGATGEHAVTPSMLSASLLVTDTQETEEVDWPPTDTEDPTPSMRKRGRVTSSDPISSDDDVPAATTRASKKRNRIWSCNAARQGWPGRVAEPPPTDVYICYRVWNYHR